MKYTIKHFNKTIGALLQWVMNSQNEQESAQAEQVYIEIPNIGMQPCHKEFIRAILGAYWDELPQGIKNNITIQ